MGESTSAAARLWSKLQVADCWDWLGAASAKGYGTIRYEGRTVYTHRLAWQLLVGAIPDGLQIDHLCRNRLCCNPDHLQPVSGAENLRRSHAVNWAKRRRESLCRRGHDLSGTNLYLAKNGSRHCRACRLAADRRRRAEGG